MYLYKLFALLTMSIDHVGAYLYPDIILLRIIGRLSLPLFLFSLVEGYSYTRNIDKYMMRILTFALISQIPKYYLQSESISSLNIFYSLALSLMLIYIVDKYKTNKLIVIPVILLIILSEILTIEYGFLPLVITLIIYKLNKRPFKLTIIITLTTIAYIIYTQQYIQVFSLLSIPIFYMLPKQNIKLSKYISYIYYPAHLFLILIIKNII